MLVFISVFRGLRHALHLSWLTIALGLVGCAADSASELAAEAGTIETCLASVASDGRRCTAACAGNSECALNCSRQERWQAAQCRSASVVIRTDEASLVASLAEDDVRLAAASALFTPARAGGGDLCSKLFEKCAPGALAEKYFKRHGCTFERNIISLWSQYDPLNKQANWMEGQVRFSTVEKTASGWQCNQAVHHVRDIASRPVQSLEDAVAGHAKEAQSRDSTVKPLDEMDEDTQREIARDLGLELEFAGGSRVTISVGTARELLEHAWTEVSVDQVLARAALQEALAALATVPDDFVLSFTLNLTPQQIATYGGYIALLGGGALILAGLATCTTVAGCPAGSVGAGAGAILTGFGILLLTGYALPVDAVVPIGL